MAACEPSRPTVFAECKLDAKRTYPEKTPTDAQVGGLVQTCMEAQGWVWRYDGDCASRDDPVGAASLERCYRRVPSN